MAEMPPAENTTLMPTEERCEEVIRTLRLQGGLAMPEPCSGQVEMMRRPNGEAAGSIVTCCCGNRTRLALPVEAGLSPALVCMVCDGAAEFPRFRPQLPEGA